MSGPVLGKNILSTTRLGQISDFDLRLLNVFRVIVESGGMSAAELELNISRSAISRYLTDLEVRLGGLTLCRRGRSGFSVTTEGQQIYESILQLQTAMDAFRSQANDVHEGITGHLSLAMSDKIATNPAGFVAEAIGKLKALAPEITLEAHVMPAQDVEHRVLDGTYKVGIVPQHQDSAMLDAFPLFSEEMALYCAPGHPLYDRDNSKLDWVGLQRYDYVGLNDHSLNAQLARRFSYNPSASAFDQEAVLTLILSASYVGFLASHYAQFFLQNDRIRKVDNPLLRYPVIYNAIVKHDPAPSRIVSTMLSCLVDAHRVD